MNASQAAAPPSATAVEEPYVGLTHFTEDYFDRFFGREKESGLVIGNLRAARLTLLYAESGVGKSSVLRAGAVARLREFAAHDVGGRGSPRVVPVVFSSWSERPGAGRVPAIREAITSYLAEGEVPELPADDLEAALEAAGQALDATVLVILDQFEEYFLYPDEEPEDKRVAAQIARCVNRRDLRANFLISIREDAYAELGDLFRGKVKNVYGNFLHLDFLDRAGAREAIEKPLERVNELQPGAEPFGVEPALVEAVLDQVSRDEEGERIETTYLQLVMRRLWGEENAAGSRVLRLQTLERLGGAQAIIGSHLDRAMDADADGAGGLGDEQRHTAATIFRFLVTSGGTKIALTAEDLADLSGLSLAEIDPVLQHLSSPRLHILRPVVFDGDGSAPRFEIFHDALAGPIVKWRTEVEEEAREARAERERAEKEEAQRAATAAKQQAQQERRRKQVAQGLLALAVLALLAGAAVFAVKQKNLADQRQADSESVQVAERISELAQVPSFGPTAAALASVEAYRLAPTTEARERALAQLQLSPALPTMMAGHTGAVESVSYWPGSSRLASGGDETVRLWRPDGLPLSAPLVADGEVLEVAVSAARRGGGRVIAAGLESKKVQLWAVTGDGEEEFSKSIAGSRGGTKGVAFDPRRPDVLATGGHDGRLRLWSLKDPRDLRPLGSATVPGEIEDIAFTADGHGLLVAGSEGGYELRLGGAGFAGPVSQLRKEEASAVAAAPNGSIAFGGNGGIELQVAHQPGRHLRLPGRIYGLAFAEGGRVLVSGGSDWNVTTWDVKTGRPFGAPRAANRAAIDDVAVSPDGRSVAAAGADRLVKVWALRPSQAPLATVVGGLSPAEAGHAAPKIYDLVVGAGGRIATPIGPRGTSIWSLKSISEPNTVPHPIAHLPGRSLDSAYHGNVLVTGRGSSFVVYGTRDACPDGRTGYCKLAPPPPKPYSQGTATGFVFAPSGRRLLLASLGRRGKRGVLNLWDLTAAEHGGRIVHLASVPTPTHLFEVSFDPKLPLIAAAARNGGVRLWDISDLHDPRPVRPTHRGEAEDQAVLAVSFSPDGSLLASGGRNQQVKLWQVSEGDSGAIAVRGTPGTLLQRQTITALAFSPGGETLAAADGGGNICLYEVDNRHLIGDRSCLRGYNTSVLKQNGGIEAMRFVRLSSGATVLLTAGRGQPIVAWNSLLWNLSDSAPAEEAIARDVCALAGRNLNPDEWSAAFASTSFAGDPHETCE
ncbi:MAG: nSTAND1 domain-containing NTPase [Solirubrobacterales bacterium]